MQKKDVARRGFGLLLAIALVGLPLAIYLGCLLVLSQSAGPPIAAVLVFDAERVTELPLDQRIASITAALAGCGFLFATPLLLAGVVFHVRSKWREAAPVWSLALNSLAVMLICGVLRGTVGLDRMTFCVGWSLWCLALGVAAERSASLVETLGSLWSRYRFAIAWSLATVGLGVVLFWPDQFLQCFNGDGTESAELARSLRHHVLPTWEIEPIDRFGATIVNPALINSYWTFGLQLLLGEGEFAARLSYWVYWFGILLVCHRIQRHFGRAGWGSSLVVSLGAILSSLWYTFYVGYDTYLCDLANPGVPDALFTLFLLLGFDSLLRRSLAGWIVSLLLASLVLYAGPVMFGLTAMAAFVWQPLERRQVIRSTLAGLALLLGVAGLYFLWGWMDGLLEGWWITLQAEYVNDYFAPLPRLRATWLFAGYFVLGCGGLPALGLIAAMRRTPWERTTATVVLAYLLIILGSAVKNLHYLGPLLPIALVLWTLRPARRRAIGLDPVPALAIVLLCVSIALSWPHSRPIFTLNREFGEQSTYQTASYEEACRWADLAVVYDLGITSWAIGPHTWVGYAHLEVTPSERRPFLVTTAERVPAGYAVRGESATGVKVCVDLHNPDWLRWSATRRPEIAPERFPWILRDVAPMPRPRLNLQPIR